MGQKVNPISNRLGIIRGWDSNWYGGKNYGDRLLEDSKIRKYLNARLAKASVSRIVIERTLKLITITVCTARPGLIIGKGGQEVDKLKEELKKITDKDVQINIYEVKRPELDADIDYALVEAHTKVGVIGVKVWICRGEVYGKKDLAPAFTNSAKEARGGNGAPKKGFRKPKTNR